MSIKNLSSVKYNQLSDVLKNLTHDVQLIGWGATERTENEASKQLAELLSDMRQITAESKLKQTAFIQSDTPPEAPQSFEIEAGEAKEGEAVSKDTPQE